MDLKKNHSIMSIFGIISCFFLDPTYLKFHNRIDIDLYKGKKKFKCAPKMVLTPLWRAADVFKRSLTIHKLIIFCNHFCIQWCTMIASFLDFTNELLMDIKWLVKLQKWKFKSSQNNAKMRLKRVFILTLQPVFIESMLHAIKGSICKLLSLIFWGAIDAQ